jgi:hypothetical protein
LTIAPGVVAAYPETAGDTPLVPSRAGALRPPDVGVYVPRVVRDGVSASAVAVYAVLLSRLRTGAVVRARHDDVMAALGRGGARPDAVARAVAELVDAGFVTAHRPVVDGPTQFRLEVLAGHQQRWDVAPLLVMDAMRAGHLGPAALVTWLHLDQRLGRRGWTTDAPEVIAAGGGRHARTVRRHVQVLAQLGALSVKSGGHRWLLTRPTPPMPAVAASDKNAGSAVTKMRTPIGRKAPEHTPPEDSPSQLCCVRPGSELAGSATAGLRPKTNRPSAPRARVQDRPDVVRVLLDAGRWCRSRDARRWLPGITTAIAERLDQGMTPAVAARALAEFVDVEHHGGRHVPAVRAALRALAADIRHGLACRTCGAAEGSRRLQEGLCGACQAPEGPSDPEGPAETVTEGHEDLLPITQRLALYRGLQMPLEQVAAIDSEAATVLRGELTSSATASGADPQLEQLVDELRDPAAVDHQDDAGAPVLVTTRAHVWSCRGWGPSRARACDPRWRPRPRGPPRNETCCDRATLPSARVL